MFDDIKKRVSERAVDALTHLQKELSSIRTGRASTAIFDSVRVLYYGTPTPLNQLATLSVPDARMVTIAPWDPAQIREIEKAIGVAGLGLTPSNDGKIIRVPIPALTEERRKELVKVVKRFGEEVKVTIRGIRREAKEGLQSMQKDGVLSEDDVHAHLDEVQKMIDQAIIKVDKVLHQKETEVLAV